MTPQPGFTSTELLKKFHGLTLRKLKWLDEHGIVKASRIHGRGGRSGQSWIYDSHQAVLIGIVTHLRNTRVPLALVRKVISSLKNNHVIPRWLLISQDHLFAVQNEQAAMRYLARLKCFALVVDVEEIRRKVSQ